MGKSEVALLLAERLDGEIVSADSMQVYRGLDVGTAKPSPAERVRVPHHLIDICDVTQSFDAAQFVRLATNAMNEIESRGRLAILSGGTGLYLKAFLYGLGTGPQADPALRAELENVPLPDLLHELAARDPETYQRIDKQNPRRVIRAIEILRRSELPPSNHRADWKSANALQQAAQAARVFALIRPMPELYHRIDTRVDQMFRDGLEAETKKLLEQQPASNSTALQAIGYRQVVEYLRGERPLQETIALVKQRTHHFARRQLTWLRHQLAVERIDWSAGQTAADVARQIERSFRNPTLTASASTTT